MKTAIINNMSSNQTQRIGSPTNNQAIVANIQFSCNVNIFNGDKDKIALNSAAPRKSNHGNTKQLKVSTLCSLINFIV